MRFLFILILVISSFPVFSQQTDTIGYRKSMLIYDYRKADGKRYQRGELADMLASRPESRSYYLKYKRAKVVGTVLALGAVAYTLFISNSQSTLNAQGRVRATAFTGVVCFWGGVVLMFNAERQKLRAVKAYNRLL